MSKWLSNVITTLVILALTSLVGAVLKGPIDDLVNENRIKAQVELAPWIDKSLIQKASPGPAPESYTASEILDNLLTDLKMMSSGSLGDFGVARISLENASSKKVTDINFRLDAPYGEHETVIVDSENNIINLGVVDRAKLPDMAPGDRIVVYMWGGFRSYLFPDKFRSYSSEGEFRLSFDWPQTQELKYQSSFSIFLDEYAWSAFFVCAIALAIIMGILVVGQGEYIKGLLKSTQLYEGERERFLSNPKTFVPNYQAVSSGALVQDNNTPNADDSKIGDSA